MRALLALYLLLSPATDARPAEPGAVRLDVTRDAWFSGVGGEADGNNGGATRLKLKTYQEMSVVDVDPKPLLGRVVTSATLHVKLAGDVPLRRVTVGSVGAEWVEGRSTNYRPERGGSTFRRAEHPDKPWDVSGGELGSVILGQGGTAWRMADASAPDSDSWQTIAVDPLIMGLRAAEASYGFVLFDDTGSEWTRNGETWTPRPMPNRFIFSRDQNAASAPYFTVTLGPEDRTPPAAPTGLRSEAGGLPAGEALVFWTTPADVGPAGTVGFFVEIGGRPTPRAMVPLAGAPGETVRFHLRDLGAKPGEALSFAVRAVDGAGNLGAAAVAAVKVSDKTPAPLPGRPVEPFPTADPKTRLPKLGASEVAVIDELDKIHPVDGRVFPDPPAGYFIANHLWAAETGRVRLYAARNEFAGFQIYVGGRDRDLRGELTFPAAPGVKTTFGRYLPVASKLGLLPDPIAPLGGPEDPGVPPKTATSQSLHADVYVSHDAPTGTHEGTLTLRSGGESLKLAVTLTVWDFTLPDRLSFLPEMNCYGLPANERAFYRLAHAHRTALNRVPYSQNGRVADGFAPAVKDARFEWSAWDARFGPLLDGSAFADLPRAGAPVDVFYLPLHENWPTPIDPNYNGDYWADRAFTPEYRKAFVDASRAFAEHMNARNWNATIFQCFFNGKNDFKKGGWSRGSSPWLLDEPASFQDFWALRFFGLAFHEGVTASKTPGRAKLAFRADVSRPEWQRDSLDGLLDYNVVGGAMRKYRRIVLDRKAAEGQVVVEYGSANLVEESNTQAVGWSLDAWTLGVDGVLPWQTVGRGDSWKEADTLALLYPGLRGKEPVPSIRLKAFRRGQQDVEYLTLLTRVTGEPRWAVAARVREALKFSGVRGGSGSGAAEDVGTVRYPGLRPEDLWALRVRVGRALSEAHPAPEKVLVDFRPPPRDPARVRPRLVGSGP